MTDIPIVKKLLAFDRGMPDFIGDKYPTCETVSYRNPDGPEAAAALKECVEALELDAEFMRRLMGDDAIILASTIEAEVSRIDATLAKFRP